jgi:hypothetical protein
MATAMVTYSWQRGGEGGGGSGKIVPDPDPTIFTSCAVKQYKPYRYLTVPVTKNNGYRATAKSRVYST